MASKINSPHVLHRIAGIRRYAITTVLVVIGAIALAGCGSSGTSGGAGPYGGTSNGAQTLTVKQSPGGTSYLTDTAGKTLYLFQADSNGKSNCNGSCAAVWPPLTGSATPGTGVTGTITTFSRSDGGKQVVLNGHPLYYYAADTAAGDTTGEGINANGGLWYVVSPSGSAVTSLK